MKGPTTCYSVRRASSPEGTADTPCWAACLVHICSLVLVPTPAHRRRSQEQKADGRTGLSSPHLNRLPQLRFDPADPGDFWSYQNEPVSLGFSHELEQEGALFKDLMWAVSRFAYLPGLGPNFPGYLRIIKKVSFNERNTIPGFSSCDLLAGFYNSLRFPFSPLPLTLSLLCTINC